MIDVHSVFLQPLPLDLSDQAYLYCLFEWLSTWLADPNDRLFNIFFIEFWELHWFSFNTASVSSVFPNLFDVTCPLELYETPLHQHYLSQFKYQPLFCTVFFIFILNTNMWMYFFQSPLFQMLFYWLARCFAIITTVSCVLSSSLAWHHRDM